MMAVVAVAFSGARRKHTTTRASQEPVARWSLRKLSSCCAESSLSALLSRGWLRIRELELVYLGRRLSPWLCRRTESLTFATAGLSTLAWSWSESARQDRAPVFQSGQAPTGLEARPVPHCHSVQHQWPAL